MTFAETIYVDDRFAKMRFYFQEQGVCTLEDLECFDFDELLFVPGLSTDDVSAAKELFLATKDGNFFLSDKNEAPFTIETGHDATNNSSTERDRGQRPDGNTENAASIVEEKANKVCRTEVVSNLPLSNRAKNGLMRAGIFSAEDLMSVTETDLLEMKNIGAKTCQEIINYSKSIALDFPGAEEVPALQNLHPEKTSELPLSNRAKNCLMQAGILSLDALMALTESDLLSMKNMGRKTCQEILDYCESISSAPLRAIKSYRLQEIEATNKNIPIVALENIGISSSGIAFLLQNGNTLVGDLCGRCLHPREYAMIQPVAEFLSTSVITHFITDFEALRDSEKTCLIRRIHGATLQEIGDELGLTRERVRQILIKACRKLQKSADLIAGTLFVSYNGTFTFAKLQERWLDEQMALCCKLVLQESAFAVYFKFSDRFVCADICPPDVDRALEEFLVETIGEGLNFYDNLERIEYELTQRLLHFFDFQDMMNYLVLHGYHFYGDYVVKGKPSYADICHDAIRKFFAFDIKLDTDENNEDMKALREIIAKCYQGLSLPSCNRALTAGVTRDDSLIVRSGRGRYCPVEKVIYNASLLDEMRMFVQNSSQTSFYYSELYAHFEGRLLAETNIDNPSFLHGMLKSLFPDEFTYERDLLFKNDTIRQSIDDRLEQLLLAEGHAITKKEIQKAIPGVNDFVIGFSAMRHPKVIQWNYREFNHVDNLIVTPEDLVVLRDILRQRTKEHAGYCSDVLLYDSACENCREFLDRNMIEHPQNLYYIVDYFFRKEYRFKRPHIISNTFPIAELSTAGIAYALLGGKGALSYEKYVNLARQFKWASGTTNAVFSELEENYIRTSMDDYIHKEVFKVSDVTLELIGEHLISLVSNYNYCALSSIFDFGGFPECEYEWNGFLLESIITEHLSDFRIIYPQVQDRRYHRGVILFADSPFTSFEDLVTCILQDSNILPISEKGMEIFLKMRGLIANVLPQEIYEWPTMVYKNELFSVKQKNIGAK